MRDARRIPCFILLPERSLANRPEACAEFFNRLRVAFGGYAYDRAAQALWARRNPSFDLEGHSVAVLVSIAKRRSCIGALKTIVREAAHDMSEPSLYVSIGNIETRFLWAASGLGRGRMAVGSLLVDMFAFADPPTSAGNLKRLSEKRARPNEFGTTVIGLKTVRARRKVLASDWAADR